MLNLLAFIGNFVSPVTTTTTTTAAPTTTTTAAPTTTTTAAPTTTTTTTTPAPTTTTTTAPTTTWYCTTAYGGRYTSSTDVTFYGTCEETVACSTSGYPSNPPC